jgi:hypothetical protein
MKKTLSKFVVVVSLVLLGLQSPANALDVTEETNATTLTNALIGSGITIVGTPTLVSSSTVNISTGLFSNGLASGLDIDKGIVFSTGKAKDLEGPNDSEFTSTDLGLVGDSDLDSIVNPLQTFDANSLTFDFTSDSGNLFFNFVFGSEEYNEYVNTNFNDVFAFLLDGTNIALVPGTSTPVSINTINNGANSSYYVDNTGNIYDTELDGFTKGLTAKVNNLSSGTHTIKITIADTNDSIYDSAVFLQGKSFSDVPIPEPASMLLTLTGIAGYMAKRRLKKDA